MHLEWLHPSCLAPPLSMTCSWAVKPPATPPLSSSSQLIIPICLHFISLDKSSNGHLIGITHIQNLEFVSCYITSYHLLCCNTGSINYQIPSHCTIIGHLLWDWESSESVRVLLTEPSCPQLCQAWSTRMCNPDITICGTCEERLVESKSHISGLTAQ
jgi:hypothetical protein